MRNFHDDSYIAELFKFVKFGITGVMNTAVDFLVFTVLSYIGLNMYLSQIISYAFGMLNSYVVNRSWTFHTNGSFFGRQMRRFLIVNLSLLAVSLVILHMVTDIFGIQKLVAKLCATTVTMVLGFIFNRLWVFRQ